MSNLFKALTLFRAHLPHSLARKLPLAQRFASRPLIGVTLRKDEMNVCVIEFKDGKPVFSHFKNFPFAVPDSEVEFLSKYSDEHEITDCLLNIETSFKADLSTIAIRPASDAASIELMHSSPETILHTASDKDTRHVVIFHPTHIYAVNFKFTVQEVRDAEGVVKRAGMTPVRVHCSDVSLLGYIFQRHWDSLMPDADLLIVQKMRVLYVGVSARMIKAVGFDNKQIEQETELLESLKERLATIFQSKPRFALVNTSSINVVDLIIEKDENVEIVPLMKDDCNAGLTACCLVDSYDLSSVMEPVRPLAPKSMLVFPVFFWVSLVCFLVAGTFFTYKIFSKQTELAALTESAKEIDKAGGGFAASLGTTKSRAKLADKVRNWLAISPSYQKLLIELTAALTPPPPKIQQAGEKDGDKDTKASKDNGRPPLKSLSISNIEGLGQFSLVIQVMSTSPSSATEAFSKVYAKLGELGYESRPNETIIPGGYQSETIVNMPNAQGSKEAKRGGK